MEAKIPVQGLLEYLSFKAGCTYLSDLREPAYLPRIQSVLCEMDPRLFDVGQWNDAVNYITGEPCRFEDSQQAAEYLSGYAAGGKKYGQRA